MYLKEKIPSKFLQPTFSWSSTWQTTHTRVQLPAQESNLPSEKHIRNSSSAKQQQPFPTHMLKSREGGTAFSLPTEDQPTGHAGPALSSLSRLYCFLCRYLHGNKAGTSYHQDGAWESVEFFRHTRLLGWESNQECVNSVQLHNSMDWEWNDSWAQHYRVGLKMLKLPVHSQGLTCVTHSLKDQNFLHPVKQPKIHKTTNHILPPRPCGILCLSFHPGVN